MEGGWGVGNVRGVLGRPAGVLGRPADGVLNPAQQIGGQHRDTARDSLLGRPLQ